MKITFLDSSTLGSVSLDSIKRLGELTAYPTSTESEALSRVSETEILIVNKVKVTENLLNAAPKLRLICEAATGVNNIDIEAAQKRGIQVKNVAGYSTDSVAQLTFAQILSFMTDIYRFDREVKDLTYSKGAIFTDVSCPYTEIAGKTIGIIGMGAIGTKVAEISETFEMQVIYYSTTGTNHCDKFKSVTLDELLAKSDIISIHAPLNNRTKGLIGRTELQQMKSTAIILNMARGGIINEDDLAEAISNMTIAGAAVDVFTSEPLPADSPLLHTKHPERLRFTPHIGWASQQAIERLVVGITNNINNFLTE